MLQAAMQQPAIASPPSVRGLSQREYLKLAELGAFARERVELIEGAIITLSPAGSLHDATVARLTRLLSAAVGQQGLVRVQMTFDAGKTSMPEPDLLVVAEGDYDDAYPAAAHLVVEVADSSLSYDRATKGAVYARAGVPVYWIVDPRSLAVEVYSRPGQGGYAAIEVLRPGDTLTVPGFPKKRLRVSDFLPVRRA
jgi:Uma2 family endonuclease